MAAATAAMPACSAMRGPPRRWLGTTPRSYANARVDGATDLIVRQLRPLAVRTLRRSAGKARTDAVRRVVRHAFMGGMLLVEADHRLHFGEHVVGKPAQALMAVAEIADRRHLRFAQLVRHQLLVAAAGLERAAGRRVHRRRDVAFQHDVLLDHAGVGDRDRRQQRLGIGMIGRREDLVGRALLDDVAEIHDDDAVGDVAHHRQIVADEQHRRLVLALDVHQQLGDRRLHRHVERRDRLVGHHHLGVAGKGPGHADALLLAARQLARHAGLEGARQLHQVEQLQHALAPVGDGVADA